MIEECVQNAELRMCKCLEALRKNLARIRTGRAQPDLIEHLPVQSYGSELPLQQVARVSSVDARTLKVMVWDKSLVPQVDKAIRESGQGLNPVTAGESIHVPLPVLSGERRQELVKLARMEAEQGRVAVRNIRREVIRELRGSSAGKDLDQDEERRGKELIQQLTDQFIGEVEALLGSKEQDLMEF